MFTELKLRELCFARANTFFVNFSCFALDFDDNMVAIGGQCSLREAEVLKMINIMFLFIH